jgi:hypothetical protein
MKLLDHTTGAADVPPASPGRSNDEGPDLPWLRTWRSVYLFVLGCFVVYVVLLALLTRAFS